MPPIKKYDQTFWYYDGRLQVTWGHIIPKSHLDARGFSSEELAYAAFQKYMDEHPEVGVTTPIGLPVGTEVYVDFDKTIYHGGLSETPREMTPPKQIVVRTLQQLHAAGYKITLYSCRSNPEAVGSSMKANQLTSYMQEYCDIHKIPYDKVEPFKPHFGILIDDRAVNGTDWVEVRKALKMDAFVAEKPEALPYDFIGLR